jgi:hypothetical protein
VIGLGVFFGLLLAWLLIVLLVYWLCRAPNALPPHRQALRWWRDEQVARERAEALLKELLTEGEYAQLERRGYLEVRSPAQPQRTYRVPRHRGQVEVRERGIPIMRLCVQSVEPIPDGDAVLMHKLMIEGNEAAYLRIANRFAPSGRGPGVGVRLNSVLRSGPEW